MVNERITDFFIGKLLDDAKIEYTPNGSKIKEIQDALKTASKKGTKKGGFPEFTAKIDEFIIIIEDKAETKNHILKCENNPNRVDLTPKATTKYAVNGAVHYAQHIIQNTNFKKIFAFGCSGDEKHHQITPVYITSNNYEILPNVENFENFKKGNIQKYYNEIVLKKEPKEIRDVKTIMDKSSELNELLWKYGQVGDSEKPLVVSAILLALNENLRVEDLTGDTVSKDGKKIHDCLDCNLQRIDVGEKRTAISNQFNFLTDRTILNEYNEHLGKTPLRYFTEYIQNEIFPSIHQSKEDILGYFYSEFIKYTGGDKQTLGIVLTPTHITELFVELLNIKPTDKVFDPCCGTGSFLISAMHHMFQEVKTEKEKDNIKKNNLHGIDIREDMFTIATTNMILRGDGKSNIILDDFFKHSAEELRENNYSIGLMNPPYSQGKTKETRHLSELQFIKHLLDSLKDNGKCAVIVPQSSMVGKVTEDKELKKQILKTHTLEGVITLNKDTTFSGVGTNPCIAVFTTYQPHPKDKRCKFINFKDDGMELRKHTGIIATERARERKEYLLKCWRDELDAPSKFMVKTKIKDTDEWLHSYYYFNDEIPPEESFKNTMGEFLSFEFNMVIKDKEYLFK